MNNKGFAITALLYGLSIMGLMTVVLMMSIMQNSRKNTSTLVRGVEQELNSYGKTAIDYTSSGDYTVPDDQGGFYKLELCGKYWLTTGTVYFPGNTVISVTVGDTSKVAVKTGDVGDIMIAGSTPYVNGMARFHESGQVKKYPFINGQVIEPAASQASGCTNGLVMNKVSSDIPSSINNSFTVDDTTKYAFNEVTQIETAKQAEVWVASYSYTSKTTNAPTIVKATQDTNKKIHTISSRNVSEIYVNYLEEPGKNTLIKVTGAAGERNVSPNSDTYEFKKTGYTFSRFSPMSAKAIQNANYVISLVSKDGSKYYLTHRRALSTSAYTPTAGSGKTMCQNAWEEANKTNSTKLVKFGSESIARPVVTSYYKGGNWQKWRIEYLSSRYKITEIEEYKPFEVNKHDVSLLTTGPILVCGEYTCVINTAHPEQEEFKSTDAWRENENQQWTLAATGLGTYRLRTNNDLDVEQYLYYDTTNQKFYVTDKKEDASIFYIYNANL